MSGDELTGPNGFLCNLKKYTEKLLKILKSAAILLKMVSISCRFIEVSLLSMQYVNIMMIDVSFRPYFFGIDQDCSTFRCEYSLIFRLVGKINLLK